ncbi:MAG: aminopeptidase [Candidatus Doudnabacteria bacterium]
MYLPSKTILDRYAKVLVRFALGSGKGIKKGEVVRVSANESAKPLFLAVCNAVVDAGGHVISHYSPDDEQGDKRRNESFTRYFYEQAEQHQLDFFPDKYLKGLVNQMDHSIFLLSTIDPHALRGVDPKKNHAPGRGAEAFHGLAA